jgi:Cysteine-rich secretory protein family
MLRRGTGARPFFDPFSRDIPAFQARTSLIMRDRIKSSSAFQAAAQFARWRFRQGSFASWLVASAAILFAACGPSIAHAATPAEMISGYRLAHGEAKVKADPALNRIAEEQAKAMAARDVLDHDALRPFGARVTQLGAIKSAENIAYGYDTFPKTLDQWIASSGHRYNLLMHGASRVGIASARSSKSGRTYWAMVIAAPEPTREKHGKGAGAKEKPCRLMINDTCL